MSLVKRAHELITNILRPTDKAIDATIGNGHDTLFLAQLVGDTGHVYGFDIQDAAIMNTMDLLQRHHVEHRVTLIKRGHQKLSGYFEQHSMCEITAIMFNLGYLPHGDKSIMTQTATSVSAVNQSLLRVKKGGIITILAYPGHAGGRNETSTLKGLIQALNSRHYETQTIAGHNNNRLSPILFAILKK